VPKILKTRNRKEQEKIYNDLNKIDSAFIEINQKLRQLKNEFYNKRDKILIERLRKNAELSANKTLLLKGRISSYELGTHIFRNREMLQFHFRYRKKIIRSSIEYVPLISTNYGGKKFGNFMKKDQGALAQIGILERTKQKIILSILIPKEKKNLIIY